MRGRAILLGLLVATMATAQERPRVRDFGLTIGVFPPGPWNAITDVPGVRVGHATVWEGDSVRTGVTAIWPHEGNPYQERVPAAIVVGNGFGKLVGLSQVAELGELETPILLTCTLCVWRAADAMVAYLLRLPGMEEVRSLNPVVAETNDGVLNDIRARPIRPEHVERALAEARSGPVPEGAVGAGTGTIAFGWKGGIGTASRRLPARFGGWTVGVLAQTNFGGNLTIAGVPVGLALGRALFAPDSGSVILVVATDAPLDARQLRRLATRALVGLARTGAAMSHGSGDYVIAFSAAPTMRRRPGAPAQPASALADEALTPLFVAVAEAAEEAILNSLFRAVTVRGYRGTAEALPLDRVRAVLRAAGRLP